MTSVRAAYVSLAIDARVPVSERVLDRLADALLDADELLGIIAKDVALAPFKPSVQGIYDRIDSTMRLLCD